MYYNLLFYKVEYTESESYTTKDSDGKTITKTRLLLLLFKNKIILKVLVSVTKFVVVIVVDLAI